MKISTSLNRRDSMLGKWQIASSFKVSADELAYLFELSIVKILSFPVPGERFQSTRHYKGFRFFVMIYWAHMPLISVRTHTRHYVREIPLVPRIRIDWN